MVMCTFVGPNGPNFTCRKIVENKSDFFRGSSLQLGLSSAHPERLLDVYFQNLEEKRAFGPDIPPRFRRFQKRSKSTKIGKNPKKWAFLPIGVSYPKILAKIYLQTNFQAILIKKSHFSAKLKIFWISL